jgi:hypothetical protein
MDLTDLRAALAADLADAGNALWTTDELDRAIRRALRDYSAAQPRRAETTLTLATAGRALDISAVSDLVGVERVWFPYDAGAPEWPPRWRDFEVWPGETLYLDVAEEPAAGEVARLFYWGLHMLDGLDGATETTLPAADEDLLALGAAGYAALEQSRAAIGAINVSSYTPLQWREWAEARLAEFDRRLDALARRRALALAGPVAMIA